jgi:hypothetical protein
MKRNWTIAVGFLFVCFGCSNGNSVIPPVGGGLDETEINQLELRTETVGRPASDEPGNPEPMKKR